MTEEKKNPSYVLTPEVRLSFPSLFEMKPRARGSDKLSYQATILIPPTVDLKPFHEAMVAAMQAKWGKVLQLPARNNPIHDCAEKAYDGYLPGWHYIEMNSDRQPGLVDRRSVPVTDKNLFYPGCWVRAFINAFAWDHPTGGKGISFGLNGLQFIRDDDRLDGRPDVSSVFTPLEDLEAPANGAPKATAASNKGLSDLFG